LKNNTFLFLTYVGLVILLTVISNYILNITQITYNIFAENLAERQLVKVMEKIDNLKKVTFIIIPITLLLKTSIIAAILDIGCFFFSKEIKYKRLFNIVVKAEFIFLLVIVFKTAWFYFFKTEYNLEDLQNFYPLSALNIIGYEGLQPWFIYPFQVLNLFELAYWFNLAYLIGKELNENTDKGFSIVASSYGVSLLIWVVGVMFFTLNIS
jgi:hypothetical protein